ncbi:MAG: hypothetical protein N2C14_29740, partial [Planctomycetales bacterium]
MSDLIVVLGMHRSGTSCLTHALHKAGLFLGSRLLNQTCVDNLDGHWEPFEAIELNDEILQAAGASWDNVPDELDARLTADHVRERVSQFVQQLRGQPIAGFKDPRTVLTYPAWKPFLGPHRIVACFRDPQAVARSLLRRRRSNWSLEKGVALWKDYNRRLIRIADSEPDVTWFEFDQAPSDVIQNVLYILRRLNLRQDIPQDELFNPFLRSTHPPEAIKDAEAARIHVALRGLAEKQRSTAGQADLTAGISESEEQADPCGRWRQLQETVNHMKEALQQHSEMLINSQQTIQALR